MGDIEGDVVLRFESLTGLGERHSEFSEVPFALRVYLVGNQTGWSFRRLDGSKAFDETGKEDEWWYRSKDLRLEKSSRDLFVWKVRRLAGVESFAYPIPRLRVECYSETWNDERAACTERTGVCDFELTGLGKGDIASRTLIEFSSRYDPDAGVGRHEGPPVVQKGTVELRFSPPTLFSSGAEKNSKKPTEGLFALREGKDDVRFFDDIDRDSVKDIDHSGFRPTLPVCERVRCPEFQLPPGGSLPGGMYVRYGEPERPVGQEFFEPLFLASMREQRVTEKDVSEWTRDESTFAKHEKALGALLVRTLGLLVWSLHYITDFSNGNVRNSRYERAKIDDRWNDTFKNTFLTLSGDCEDLSWLFYRLFRQFVSAKTGPYRRTSLERMRTHYRRFYVAVLATCVASEVNEKNNLRKAMEERNKRRTDREGDRQSPMTSGTPVRDERVNSNNAVSHTVCLLLPLRLFVDMVQRCKKVHDSLHSPSTTRQKWRHVSNALDGLLASRGLGSEGEWGEGGRLREVLFCEGTYPTLPLHPSSLSPRDLEASREARDFLSRHPSLYLAYDSLKSIEDDVHDRFCKVFVRGFTDVLWEFGLRSLDVCFVRYDANSRESGTYGLWSDEFLDTRLRSTLDLGLFFYNFLSAEEATFFGGRASECRSVSSLSIPGARDVSELCKLLRGLLPNWSADPGSVFHGTAPFPGSLPLFSLRLKNTHCHEVLRGALRRLREALDLEGRFDVVFEIVPCHDGAPILRKPILLLRFDFYDAEANKVAPRTH